MTQVISVFGLGYVGSVTAACFAHLGNHVLGVDVNRDKVEMLNSGRSPILEPGLEEIVRRFAPKNRAAMTMYYSTASPPHAKSQSHGRARLPSSPDILGSFSN